MPALDVLPAWIAKLEADSVVRKALGGTGRIYPVGTSREIQVPSIEWSGSAGPEAELFETAHVQLDLFIRTWAKAWQVEARIRQLSHRDVMQTMGSARCWIQYSGARSIPFPSDPGVMHRALEFTVQTVRSELAH